MWWLLFQPFWPSWALPGGSMAKRELIDTDRDKPYVHRVNRGQLKESDDVGRSLATARRRRAKSKPSEADKGDRPRAKTKRKATSKAGRKAARKSAGRKGTARRSARNKAAKRR